VPGAAASLGAVGRLSAGATVALLLVTAGLSSGCGAQPSAAGAAVTTAATPSVGRPATVRRPARPRPRVVVIVRNGDTGRRVAGARVRIGAQSRRTDGKGVAVLPVRRVRPLPVSASARGYGAREVVLGFDARRRYRTLSLYEPKLQWTMYGANPQRTQAHPAIELRPPFRVLWRRTIGYIEFPASVSDGVAFISNIRGIVRAVDMRTGALLWQRNTPNGKMAATPAVVGDVVVAHGMDGNVWVLDRATGRVRWRWYVGSPVESSPIVAGGVDYFGAWNGNVYALDLRRRRLRWVFHAGYKITSSAALSGGSLLIGDYGGRVWSLSRATGRERWVGSVGARIYGTPAVSDGRVFVPSSQGGTLTAFTLSGNRLWSISTGAYVYSSPAVWDGRVYFGSFNGVLYCVSAAAGRILWTYSSGRAISGAPTVVAGIVYFSNTGRRTYGLDARSGRSLMSFDDGDYVPVSGNGSRLLLHGFATLYGVAPR
jgi:outer membrane protein assembly factor BamB